MSHPVIHPSEKWEIEKAYNELGSRRPSISLESLEAEVKEEETAETKGRRDGLSKVPMDPYYLEMVQTDKHSIGRAYAEAYKIGRERAYKKTGSNRRKQRKGNKKTIKKLRKHRR